MDNLDINRVVESVALVILALIFVLALQPLIKRLMSPRGSMPGPAGSADGLGVTALEGGEAVPALPGPDTPAVAGAEGGENGETPEGLPAPDGTTDVTRAIDFAQIQGQVKDSSVRKVGEIVHSHPEESIAILRSWLHESV